MVDHKIVKLPLGIPPAFASLCRHRSQPPHDLFVMVEGLDVGLAAQVTLCDHQLSCRDSAIVSLSG
jgi:hypothetical protein